MKIMGDTHNNLHDHSSNINWFLTLGDSLLALLPRDELSLARLLVSPFTSGLLLSAHKKFANITTGRTRKEVVCGAGKHLLLLRRDQECPPLETPAQSAICASCQGRFPVASTREACPEEEPDVWYSRNKFSRH